MNIQVVAMLSSKSSVLIVICCLMISCFGQDVDRQLLGKITLSPEWLELEPEQPLKPSRQVQMIVLVTSESFEPDFDSRGIRLEDGAIAVPQIQILDQDGNRYDLTTQTVSGTTEVSYWKAGLPADRVYTKVRLRSNHSISCARVLWRCHNFE
jgi:hypothetical protein